MKFGWTPEEHAFRLLAPDVTAVSLILRQHPDGPAERILPMHRVTPQAWEIREANPWHYYRFRIERAGQVFDVADPRAGAVARQFVVGHPTWSVAHITPFDWQGDARPGLDVASAVLLEVHVRDFTVHPSAKSRFPGTYQGLGDAAPGVVGGLAALRDLGVNAVELMPIAAFPYLESTPGKNPQPHDNPTGVNHWGYMPSFLFAPSERYAARGAIARHGAWVGVDQDGTFHDPGVELKEMIRSLHRAGIAVVLDVVFNHVSAHDNNPLLRLDPGTWFHRNPDGTLRSHSGCGNDLNTTEPAMRQLVIDAVSHWLREYRVDGFRLDLAEILDDDTLRGVRAAAMAEYPRALVIAEPWSMTGYRPVQIAALGHTIWNDRYRNGFKGQEPHHGRGFLLGAWQGGATRGETAALLGGWSRDVGGPLESPHLSLNYLESHDNYTLGDFVRMALGLAQPVRRADLMQLPAAVLRVLKLAAAALLLSRGVAMLAQGQEWGRAKVIAGRTARTRTWLDGNSYNRDDATNHLDWAMRASNPELVDWHRRLIDVRKQWLLPAFAEHRPIRLFPGSRDHAIGYTVDTSRGRVAVLLNATPDGDAWFNVAGGPWWMMLGAEHGHIVPIVGGVSVRVDRTAAVVLFAT